MASIKIYPYLSPRIVEILYPATEITVQELVDLIRDWEDSDDGMPFEYIISAAGKEDLGGGVTVGITATLNNAQIMFTGRTIPIDDGVGRTCDATDSNGIQLYVDDADFISAGVSRGDIVYNPTTREMATILEVIDQYTLDHVALSGNGNLGWTIGDSYVVYHNAQCSISGGNLVAVDETGTSISSVLQSPNVQVVRTSSSSATLQELGAIQYSSFNGGVTVDIANLTGKAVAGTEFPIGTPEAPCNNITDAYSIAEERGFPTFYIIGDLNITSAFPPLDNYTFIGESQSKSTITIADAAEVYRCEFQDASLDGTLDGACSVNHCIINDLIYVNGVIYNSIIGGSLTLGGSEVAYLINCASGIPGVMIPYIDMGGSGQSLIVRNYNGELDLRNKTGTDVVSIDLNSGSISIDSTVTNGEITIRGIGKLIDNSNGATIIAEDLLNKENIVKASWDMVWLDTIEGVSGTAFPIGTPERPVNNITDALTILSNLGTDKIHLHGSITLNADIANTKIAGDNYNTAIINLNNVIVDSCDFTSIGLVGNAGATSYFNSINCKLSSITNINGTHDDVYLEGLITIATNGILNCDRVVSPAGVIIDMNGSTTLGLGNLSGVVTINNCTNPSALIGVTGYYILTLSSSCTNGTALLAGIGVLTNNSNMSVTDKTLPYANVVSMESLFYSSYLNKVVYESTGTSGTASLIGTLEFPVNNIQDAITIANSKNITNILCKDSITLSTGDDVSNFTLSADDVYSIITAETDAICVNTRFNRVGLTGVLDGGAIASGCKITDLTVLNGTIENSMLGGTIVLGGNINCIISNCFTRGDDYLIIDMGGEGQSLKISNFNGKVKITNKTGIDDIFIDINSGEILFTESVTDGTIRCRGVGQITQDLSKGAVIYDALVDGSDLVKPPGGIIRVNQVN